MMVMQLTKTAFRSMSHHKIRSLLTMLGIIIGIAAVNATMSIGYSTQEHMKKQLMAMGDNYIWVCAQTTGVATKKSSASRNAQTLTIDDAYAVKKQCPAVKRVSPHLTHVYDLSFLGKNIRTVIKSGNEEYLSIIGRKIDKGCAFTHEHSKKKAKVIILGPDLVKILFNGADPCQKTLFIKNIPFTVIGVFKKLTHYVGDDNPNLEAIVPLSTAKTYLSTSRKYNARKIAGMTLSAHSQEAIPVALRQIRQLLRSRHRLETGTPDDFTLQDQLSLMDTAQKSSDSFALFLFIIASISLLVGGIGVMNIMLVCVSERKQEIGIRMALGATSRLLQLQFLVEAVMLTVLGGVLGTVVGILIPLGAQFFTPWPLLINYASLWWSSLIIISLGLLFGYYPARKASRLNPIVALSA